MYSIWLQICIFSKWIILLLLKKKYLVECFYESYDITSLLKVEVFKCRRKPFFFVVCHWPNIFFSEVYYIILYAYLRIENMTIYKKILLLLFIFFFFFNKLKLICISQLATCITFCSTNSHILCLTKSGILQTIFYLPIQIRVSLYFFSYIIHEYFQKKYRKNALT